MKPVKTCQNLTCEIFICEKLWACETTTEANEDDGKVLNSNSEAVVDNYPGNADDTTKKKANEDVGKVSNSNSEAAIDTYPRNADETWQKQMKMMEKFQIQRQR